LYQWQAVDVFNGGRYQMKQKHTCVYKNQAKRKSFRIALIYFILGCLWIIVSDMLSRFMFSDSLILFNILKGLTYVTVTALIIYQLICSAMKDFINTEMKLKENGMLYRTIFEQSPIGISIAHSSEPSSGEEDTYQDINPMFCKITGRTKEEIIRLGWAHITHPDDLQLDLDQFKKLQAGEISSYAIEKRYVKPDGSSVWVYLISASLNNEKYKHIGLVQDITERKIMERNLQESERSKAVLLSNLPGMAYRCNYDREWTMQFVSQGCFELTGYTAESLLYNKNLSFNDLILPEYRDILWCKWQEILEKGLPFQHEYEIITASGQKKWILELGQGIYDDNGTVIALEGIIIDISDRKENESKLQRISEIDSLTGLYNRRYLENILSATMITGVKKAILLLNLKKINSIRLLYGYNFSENLIKTLADTLSALCFDHIRLFQVSFERFVFYYEGYQNQEELKRFCSTIIETISKIQLLHIVGCGIGVLEMEQSGCDADCIIKHATIASELVEPNTMFGYQFFNADTDASVKRDSFIREALLNAAHHDINDYIFLHYQPILNLKTNTIQGFEALARFYDENIGDVSPNEFIPLAEETQLIVPIGKKIIGIAFSFMKELYTRGFENIHIYINVSAIQVLKEDFIDDIADMLSQYRINPHTVGFEITETVFAENYAVINEKLNELKNMGIKISIDDFGTGYSSLARESELNINCLKIDRYFINKIRFDKADKIIISDIISMAHKLGHQVVAEGVENEEQKQYLIEHHCDMMQGYLFSKPVDEASAIDLLQKTNLAAAIKQ